MSSTDASGNSAQSQEYSFTTPVIEVFSCDAKGVEKDVFNVSETIYAKVSNYHGVVDVYIVDNATWHDGMKIESYRNKTTASIDGEAIVAIWSNPEKGYYDVVVDVDRDGYYNSSIDAVDEVSALPGVKAIIVSTQIEINSLNFGDVVANESAYYYVTSEGVASVTENVNATGILPFAIIQGGEVVQVSLGTNRTLPFNATLYLDDDTVPASNDSSMVIIRGNESNVAEIAGISTITANNLYVFMRTGNAGEFNVDVVLTIL